MSSIQYQRILDYAYSKEKDANGIELKEEDVESLPDEEKEQLIKTLRKARNDAVYPRIKEVLELLGYDDPEKELDSRGEDSKQLVDEHADSATSSEESVPGEELPRVKKTDLTLEEAREMYRRHVSKLLAGFRLGAALFCMVFFVVMFVVAVLFGGISNLIGSLLQTLVSVGFLLGAFLFWIYSSGVRYGKLLDRGKLVEVQEYESPVPLTDYTELLPGFLRNASILIYYVFWIFNKIQKSIVPISVVKYSAETTEDDKPQHTTPDFYLEGEAVVENEEGTAFALVDPDVQKRNSLSWLIKTSQPE